jgi:hypothetical protein
MHSLKLDADGALKQYTGDPDWMYKTGLGGVLTAACFLTGAMDAQHLLLLPVALAFAAIITGYLLRVVRMRVKKPDGKRLAEWNEWMDLFMSGITWIAVQFGINVLGFSIVSVFVVLAVYAVQAQGANAIAIVEVTLLAVLLTVFWFHFLTTFLWVNFAVEERVGGALALRKVVGMIRGNPVQFLTAWALSTALYLAALLIPSATVIGIFIVPTTTFAAQLISANLLAQLWEDS